MGTSAFETQWINTEVNPQLSHASDTRIRTESL